MGEISTKMHKNTPLPIQRQDGITPAERYLKRLCDHTFLSLWSYSRVFRYQGGGKELCDLLVICGHHVVIFSDKDCTFPDTDDIRLSWCRWYRRAVADSARQIWGAERWLKEPTRLFLDQACSIPFPLTLPDPGTAIIHRVVVAHGVMDCCRKFFGGGSGSLIVNNSIKGEQHYGINECEPFMIGLVDPTRGFIHVLDDVSLDIVLKTLDTITDFTTYLTAREALLTSGKAVFATGEEELLALYLRDINPEGRHDFILPDCDTLLIQEGMWEQFIHHPQRRAQLHADQISYFWDELIERFSHHIQAGTQHRRSHDDVASNEKIIRFMAREPRVRRRMLANAIVDLDAKNQGQLRAVRVSIPSEQGEPHYVFLLLDRPPGMAYEEYREGSYKLLYAYCQATKVKFPDAEDIVGIAIGPLYWEENSEDAIYLNAHDWTPEDQAEAESLRADLGLFKEMNMFYTEEKEYPAKSQRYERGIPSYMNDESHFI